MSNIRDPYTFEIHAGAIQKLADWIKEWEIPKDKCLFVTELPFDGALMATDGKEFVTTISKWDRE